VPFIAAAGLAHSVRPSGYELVELLLLHPVADFSWANKFDTKGEMVDYELISPFVHVRSNLQD
jgi:hypothetical protein